MVAEACVQPLWSPKRLKLSVTTLRTIKPRTKILQSRIDQLGNVILHLLVETYYPSAGCIVLRLTQPRQAIFNSSLASFAHCNKRKLLAENFDAYYTRRLDIRIFID